LANLYLDPLDHLLAAAGWQMVRYADDFVILCRSEDEAKAALACVQTWVQNHGLMLHPEKTRIVDATLPEVLTSWGITSSEVTAGRAARRWTGSRTRYGR